MGPKPKQARLLDKIPFNKTEVKPFLGKALKRCVLWLPRHQQKREKLEDEKDFR